MLTTLDAATTDTNAGEEDGADRRTAGKLLAVGTLSAVLTPPAALERIMTHGDRPVEARLIADHEDLAETLAAKHHTARADSLFGLVATHANQLYRLLDLPTAPGADRQHLEGVMVGAHAQAGMLAFNAGSRADARRYFALARDIADDADDNTLRAQALGFSSVLYSSSFTGGYGGNAPRAVRLMSEAAYYARRADPGTRAWIAGWLAKDQAATGDERGFFESVQLAERLTGETPKGDGRGFFARNYSRNQSTGGYEQLVGNVGVGLALLKRCEEATDTLTSSLIPGWPRHTIVALTGLAAIHVLQGEPEQACEELRQALNLAIGSGYAMGVERVRGVRARFSITPTNWAQLPCVIEFDEQLRAATTPLQRKR